MWQHNPKIERERVKLQEKLEAIFGGKELAFDILLFSYLLSYTTRGTGYIHPQGEALYPLTKINTRYENANVIRNPEELITTYDLFGRLAFCMLYLETFLGPFACYPPVRQLLIESITTKQMPEEDKKSELALLKLLLDKRKSVSDFIKVHIKDCNFLGMIKHVKAAIDDESPLYAKLTNLKIKDVLTNLLKNRESITPQLKQYLQQRERGSDVPHGVFKMGCSKTDKINGVHFLSDYYRCQDRQFTMSERQFNAINESGSKLNATLLQFMQLQPSENCWIDKIPRTEGKTPSVTKVSN